MAGAPGGRGYGRRPGVEAAQLRLLAPRTARLREAAQIIHSYGNGGDSPPSIAVVSVPQGQSVAANKTTIADAFAAVRRIQPELRVVDLGVTGDSRFVTNNGDSTYALIFSPRVSAPTSR